MKFVVKKQMEVAPGAYCAVFAGVEEEETKIGTCLRWSFIIKDGKYAGTRVSGLTPSANPTTKNKLGRWLAALAGKSEIEGEIDPARYLGCRYSVTLEQNGDYTNVTEISKVSVKVTEDDPDTKVLADEEYLAELRSGKYRSN